jgi:hypothetical protein
MHTTAPAGTSPHVDPPDSGLETVEFEITYNHSDGSTTTETVEEPKRQTPEQAEYWAERHRHQHQKPRITVFGRERGKAYTYSIEPSRRRGTQGTESHARSLEFLPARPRARRHRSGHRAVSNRSSGESPPDGEGEPEPPRLRAGRLVPLSTALTLFFEEIR